MPLSQNLVSRKLSIAAERPEGATALYNIKIHRAGQPVFQNLAVNHSGAESICGLAVIREVRSADLIRRGRSEQKSMVSLTNVGVPVVSPAIRK
jgi:hypothetical protein